LPVQGGSEKWTNVCKATGNLLILLRVLLVQSCWNGIAVLDPAPFYNPPHVRFRMARLQEGECSASECGLICSKF